VLIRGSVAHRAARKTNACFQTSRAARHAERSRCQQINAVRVRQAAPKRAQAPLRARACLAPAALRRQKPNAVPDEPWYDCGSNTVVGNQARSPNPALQLTAPRARSCLFLKLFAQHARGG
jgi:hypothetical protein